MAKIQKIFFYSGTALMDPNADCGCPFHPDQNQGLCKAVCNKPLVPAYQCPDHPKRVSPKPNVSCSVECGQELRPYRYACPKHHDILKSEPGRCGKKCGKKAINKDVGPTTRSEKKTFFENFYYSRKIQYIKWGCPDHFDQQRFDQQPAADWQCPVEVCSQELKPLTYKCPDHPNILKQKTRCTIECGRTMGPVKGKSCCPNHHQKAVDAKDGNCKEKCGGKTQYPLETALGYRRNVSVFMDYVGRHVDGGEGWGFCVNAACDPKDNKKSNKSITLSAGNRKFRYYAPETVWNVKETKVDDYFKNYEVLNGKSEVLVNTSSLLKNREAVKSMSWDDRYKLVQKHGKDKDNEKMVDNCSSRCFVADLNWLMEGLSKVVENQDVFAVCDCNSFHNSAFLFGLLALSKYVEPDFKVQERFAKRQPSKGKKVDLIQDHHSKPILILNFDRHTDYGGDKKVVASDGWGGSLLRSFQCGAYLAIGVPPFGTIDLYIRTPKKSEKETEDNQPPKKDDKPAIPEEVESSVGKGIPPAPPIMSEKEDSSVGKGIPPAPPIMSEKEDSSVGKGIPPAPPTLEDSSKGNGIPECPIGLDVPDVEINKKKPPKKEGDAYILKKVSGEDLDDLYKNLQELHIHLGDTLEEISKKIDELLKENQYTVDPDEIHNFKRRLQTKNKLKDIFKEIGTFLEENRPESLTKEKLKEKLEELKKKYIKGLADSKKDDKKYESAENWKAVFKEIEKYINNTRSKKEKPLPFKHYYLTIDRDCMLHNYNQWGDDLLRKDKGESSFFHDEKHIYEAIKAIQKSLGEDAVLTGMDITGLPESQYLPGTINSLTSRLSKQEIENIKREDPSCPYPKCREKCDDKNCTNKDYRNPNCKDKNCRYPKCNDPHCPGPQCESCRTHIMKNLSKEIDFWYKKFDGWISKQKERQKQKV